MLTENGVFQENDTLKNIINKDVVTQEIQKSLLNAQGLGAEQMKVFINKRLCEPPQSEHHLNIRAPIKKNKAKTFTSLYEVAPVSKNKQKAVKADRTILQRLLTAYKAGRKVNLEQILKHELMIVPLALASTTGSLHSTNKSILMGILTKNVPVHSNINIASPSTLIIDGQALVMSIGKSPEIKTFGNYADKFANTVFKMGEKYQRIDIVFDRYYKESIKSGRRIKRKQKYKPIRKKIENEATPMPADWSNFLSLEENKVDLALLLSNFVISHSPMNKVIVVSGGFEKSTTVRSSNPDLALDQLIGNHEEADTRMILRCKDARTHTIVVAGRDTDVFLLLIAHFHRIGCTELYMKAGTSADPKYIPIHKIQEQISQEQTESLLGFHAITGCDSVSQFSGHGKKTTWQVFLQHHNDLFGIGKGNLSDNTIKSAEKFICKLYGVPEVQSCDQARVKLFCLARPQESLPPTSDAALSHIKRSHYQASIWNQAHLPNPNLPDITEMGWIH